VRLSSRFGIAYESEGEGYPFLAERYPRASYHPLDAAGYNMQIEQAGLFGAAFGGWIGSCEA